MQYDTNAVPILFQQSCTAPPPSNLCPELSSTVHLKKTITRKGASICSYNPLQGFQKIKSSGHNSWTALLIAVWCGHCGHLLQAAGHRWRLPTRQGSDPAQEPHLHLPHSCCHGKERSQQLRPQQVRIEYRQETSILPISGKLLTKE